MSSHFRYSYTCRCISDSSDTCFYFGKVNRKHIRVFTEGVSYRPANTATWYIAYSGIHTVGIITFILARTKPPISAWRASHAEHKHERTLTSHGWRGARPWRRSVRRVPDVGVKEVPRATVAAVTSLGPLAPGWPSCRQSSRGISTHTSIAGVEGWRCGAGVVWVDRGLGGGVALWVSCHRRGLYISFNYLCVWTLASVIVEFTSIMLIVPKSSNKNVAKGL